MPLRNPGSAVARSKLARQRPDGPMSKGVHQASPAPAPEQSVGSDRNDGDGADSGVPPADNASGTFPIQATKVQRPPLRAETLRRDRLLDWLNSKIHSRLIFVSAEAGYGKTTLLSDFARRSRPPTLWYRLDEEDRNWVSFINYLVAAGRQIDPTFAPGTFGLLRELGTSAPSRSTVVEAFIRELGTLGSGSILIFDDYHLVDDVPEVQAIMRDIVARAPERMTLVVLSRRVPTLPVARLRAQGEIAELTTDDLRFDQDETERLFRDTYGRPLDPDVLSDLSHRTEGWAASLQLVQSALRDRSAAQVRSFIRNLSGAHGELHDYLAEEVVGTLDEALQAFLMRTSILQTVDPVLASVVTGRTVEDAGQALDESERLGLISRRAELANSSLRFHPLVRDFLEARLRREIGAEGVVELHRTIARFAESRDWGLAAYHYANAGDTASLFSVIIGAVEIVMGGGEFARAASYVESLSAYSSTPVVQMILSRIDINADRISAALRRAHLAYESFGEEDRCDVSNLALANLMSLLFTAGNLKDARERAKELEQRTQEGDLRMIAQGLRLAVESSTFGDIVGYRDHLMAMARKQEARGHEHYLGITYHNVAAACRALGDAPGAVKAASDATTLLEGTSAGHEVASAKSALAWGLAHEGRLAEARAASGVAVSSAHALGKAEVLIESADIENWYGDALVGEQMLHEAHGYAIWQPQFSGLRNLSLAHSLIRQSRLEEAADLVAALDRDEFTAESAYGSRQLAMQAQIAIGRSSRDASEIVDRASAWARKQRAGLWVRYCRLLRFVLEPAASMNAGIRSIALEDPAILSMAAEAIVGRLGDLDDDSMSRLTSEVALRPERWRQPLRDGIRTVGKHGAAAACLLDLVGAEEDVLVLRSLAKRLKGALADPELGRGLARRLAPAVFVEDLGRVAVTVGQRTILGTELRRKVLSLLCFLITRPNLAATRDEVLEALWPDLEPVVAVNSLNQTIYFLRRAFEPGYKDDLSAGYVHHDSDVIWLDQTLIRARSVHCRELLRSVRGAPSSDTIEMISSFYTGRFALDFSYEEWAGSYRDSLHAAYLEVVERSVSEDRKST